MERFVLRSSKDPHLGAKPSSSEATDTPSTSLSANASGAPDYLNLLVPSRPNLNLFPKDKNTAVFVPDDFELPAQTDKLNSASEVAKSFLISKAELPST